MSSTLVQHQYKKAMLWHDQICRKCIQYFIHLADMLLSWELLLNLPEYFWSHDNSMHHCFVLHSISPLRFNLKCSWLSVLASLCLIGFPKDSSQSQLYCQFPKLCQTNREIEIEFVFHLWCNKYKRIKVGQMNKTSNIYNKSIQNSAN